MRRQKEDVSVRNRSVLEPLEGDVSVRNRSVREPSDLSVRNPSVRDTTEKDMWREKSVRT